MKQTDQSKGRAMTKAEALREIEYHFNESPDFRFSGAEWLLEDLERELRYAPRGARRITIKLDYEHSFPVEVVRAALQGFIRRNRW